MGSPTLATLKLVFPPEITDEKIIRLHNSGALARVLAYPDYDALAASLPGERGEPVIRRARRLIPDTCGPYLHRPLDGARILTDVYGEKEGSFDLTTVELFNLDTSLTLGLALESAMHRRNKVSMGARRGRWFVKNANARTLPEPQQSFADLWRKEGFVLFFADSSWEDSEYRECFECVRGEGGQWIGDCVSFDTDVLNRHYVLVGR